LYEEDLVHDPYNVSTWWRYIFSKQHSSFEERVFVFERAVSVVPASYKIWKEYLDFRRRRIDELMATEGAKRKRTTEGSDFDIRQEYRRVNYLYERALVLLNKASTIGSESHDAKTYATDAQNLA
jgi:pre-mRNA-splicing factor SYF1